jgi:hypothetical protein
MIFLLYLGLGLCYHSKRGEKMRDIPFFDTQNGVAALVLKEIPYSQKAYITVLSAIDLVELLNECVAFCRMVGAEQIYATGSEELQSYPVWMQLLQMQIETPNFGKTTAALCRVTEDTLNHWVEIYNQKMRKVDNASYMTQNDAKKILSQGNCYFINREGERLGIIMAGDQSIQAVASCVPGGAAEGIRALMQRFQWNRITLEVASTNHKAITLYKSLGFAEIGVISTWYKIY